MDSTAPRALRLFVVVGAIFVAANTPAAFSATVAMQASSTFLLPDPIPGVFDWEFFPGRVYQHQDTYIFGGGTASIEPSSFQLVGNLIHMSIGPLTSSYGASGFGDVQAVFAMRNYSESDLDVLFTGTFTIDVNTGVAEAPERFWGIAYAHLFMFPISPAGGRAELIDGEYLASTGESVSRSTPFSTGIVVPSHTDTALGITLAGGGSAGVIPEPNSILLFAGGFLVLLAAMALKRRIHSPRVHDSARARNKV